jgi:ABC-2 type transport system ATP-binding protein
MSIVIKEVSKYYGKQKALSNVSFEVNKGEVFGFIGPNGAGKSTLMKIITGYLPPSSGSIQVCGFDTAEASMDVKRRIGYLPENNPLYLYMYVEEYLRFFAGIHQLGKQSEARIAEVIDLTGLGNEKHKKLGALSKGYRQRAGLAQAILHNPEVLILDEPTTGLDPNQIVEIRSLISSLGKEKTVMLSTHIMQEVEAICNRVVIINKGQIVADGQPESLIVPDIEDKVLIQLELSGKIEEKAFLQLSGIIAVKQIGENQYEIETNANVDVRSDLFRFAVENKVEVLGMQKKETHMEDVFRKVTK